VNPDTMGVMKIIHGHASQHVVRRLVLAWLLLCSVVHAEVLSVLGSDGIQHEYEAVNANWNQELEDAGQAAFAGSIYFDESNPCGCHPYDDVQAHGRLLLVDTAALCDDYASTSTRAAQAGVLGIIFFHHSAGLTGIALGNSIAPLVRAVMIERRHGEAVRAMLLEGTVTAELKRGLLISEDAYEEQFILRADEIASTRSVNFLWHRHPEMLRSAAGGRLLSTELAEQGLSAPDDWFTRAPPFVPLFNPSLVSLEDGSLLATLRMSNGPGCPSVRRSRESSMDTRIFRNELVLVHIDPRELSVLSYVVVTAPPLSCYFSNNTKLSGRQFLDSVHGPMDARLVVGDGGELWVSFYAERNIPESEEIVRGIHAAPLHLTWQPCRTPTWQRTNSTCTWLAVGDSAGLPACRKSCEAMWSCSAVLFSQRRSACVLQHCRDEMGSERPVPLGWEAWHLRERRAQQCLGGASIKEEELVSFPATNQVEKNWNLIQITQDRLVVEYHVDPHIVLEGMLVRAGGVHLVSLATLAVSRWPQEVLHGVTNVRGGYCCLRLPEEALREARGGGSALPDGPLLLGCGHLQRIRTPFDQAQGDVNRFRRQAKSRAYHQFFYALRPEPPFDVVAISAEWCITLSGHFSSHWHTVLKEGEDACEAIQFAGGLALRNAREVVVGYGINDCEGGLLPLPLMRVLAMLRPVQSNLNVSLDDLEMI